MALHGAKGEILSRENGPLFARVRRGSGVRAAAPKGDTLF